MNTAELVKKLNELAEEHDQERKKNHNQDMDMFWFYRGQAVGVRQAIKIILEMEVKKPVE